MLPLVCRLLGAVLVTIAGAVLVPTAIPPAAADACPDVQVIFARGTFEPPGIGDTGQAFTDALRSQVGTRTVDVYPVDYPASLDFPRAADGIVDANNKIRQVIDSCPKTKIVLGGYSQGAAVIAYLTTDTFPDGFVPPVGISGPMPASVADHVAAVALFGKPSSGFLNIITNAAPPITIGQRYMPKTIDLCIDGDPVCSPGGGTTGVHNQYAVNGMAGQAAGFAAGRINSRTT